MIKRKRYGRLELVDKDNSYPRKHQCDVVITGHLDNDPFTQVAISANGAIELDDAGWIDLKERVDNMFKEVKKRKGAISS